ncbi:MAG TPA: Crp/Fnr family transcriptional regulator [Flavobacteriales bacterium]|nr:Crp/Fnr family transcriptional regulator [Flavobacteriales bacterium]
MKKNLEYLLKAVSPFDPKNVERIIAAFHPRVVKKNQVLLSAGEVCNEFYFVNKGCLRTYFITKQGHEKTRYIILDPSIGTAFTSFISQKPSFEYVDAIEKTELLVIKHTDFYRLAKEIPQWKDFYIKILEMAYSFQNTKIETLVTLTAKQRYDLLYKENPKLVKRLSNKMLASYLDITQETLSRLKSA